MSWFEHKKYPDSNARNVLIWKQEMSWFEHTKYSGMPRHVKEKYSDRGLRTYVRPYVRTYVTATLTRRDAASKTDLDFWTAVYGQKCLVPNFFSAPTIFQRRNFPASSLWWWRDGGTRSWPAAVSKVLDGRLHVKLGSDRCEPLPKHNVR